MSREYVQMILAVRLVLSYVFCIVLAIGFMYFVFDKVSELIVQLKK